MRFLLAGSCVFLVAAGCLSGPERGTGGDSITERKSYRNLGTYDRQLFADALERATQPGGSREELLSVSGRTLLTVELVSTIEEGEVIIIGGEHGPPPEHGGCGERKVCGGPGEIGGGPGEGGGPPEGGGFLGSADINAIGACVGRHEAGGKLDSLEHLPPVCRFALTPHNLEDFNSCTALEIRNLNGLVGLSCF